MESVIGSQPKLPTPKDVPAEMSCDSAADIINDWLVSCKEHAECNSHNFFAAKASEIPDGGELGAEKSDFDPSLPKRLIQLGENAKTDRLVQTAQLLRGSINSRAPYAALSYCWGGNGTFKTELHTLPEFEKDIQVEKLPQTIKDAFDLTKRLGLNYLWVDAICIVQGVKEEWEEESQKMGHIYSNAKIVLSAMSSASVTDGMFTTRTTTPLSKDIEALGGLLRVRRNLNHEIIISCRTKSNYWWEKHINAEFPLLSRGWAFQERMLATRIVHFTPSELVWECQKTRKCECRVVESNLYPAMNNLGSALRICLQQPNDERSMRQMWREIVNSYSVRKLTQIEDKLPALGGIAGLLKERSGDIYAAGLWERSLPFDLLWRCDQSAVLQSKKMRSPSWSWISVDGAVKWPVSQHSNEEQPLKYISSTTYFECGAEGVEVCDVECELDGNDKYGRVRTGRIMLKTRLTPTTIHYVSDETWKGMYGTDWAVQAGISAQAPFWPDISQKGLHSDPCRSNMPDGFYLMEVMKSRDITGSWEEALVVRSKCGLEYEYERVGVAANVSPASRQWTTGKSWFDSPHSDKIILI